MDVWLLWAMRVGWVLLPLVGGPSVTAALGDGATGTTATVLAWVAFGLGLVAMAVPRTLPLTVLRVVAPASVPFAVFTVVRTDAEAGSVIMLVLAVLVTVLAMLADIGNLFADGSSYGPERRMLLRPSSAVMIGAVPLAWMVLVVGVVAPPLLLADGRWIIGILAAVVGIPAAFFLFVALHRLTQRWLVFVPAGLVIVDHTTLTDPVLVRSEIVDVIGPAVVGASEGMTDLTADAAGLVLSITTDQPLVIARVTAGEEPTVTESTTGVLISPSRPGAVLAEAESRGLPVGQPRPTTPNS